MSGSFNFWLRWLLILSSGIILFGMLMAFGSASPPFELFNHQIDPLFWGSAPPQEALAFRGWIYGLLGATMAGWGAFFLFLTHYALRRREIWAWNCLLAGMLVWFIPDTAISWTYGVAFNILFNCVLLLLVLLPLLAMRKRMIPDQ